MKTIYERIIQDPRYLTNIEYGEPRRGHAEGKVKAHIANLEENLQALVDQFLVSEDRYWKLKVLIHVHDTFKKDAKRDSAILDPQSHASLARAFLAEFTDDPDMLLITQFHDIGFAVYKKWLATGRLDEQKLLSAIGPIQDHNLLLLFAIIDVCTPSKGRKMIRWFVEEVNKSFPGLVIRPEHILPGPDEVEGAW